MCDRHEAPGVQFPDAGSYLIFTFSDTGSYLFF
jgi:hypothetical protein